MSHKERNAWHDYHKAYVAWTLCLRNHDPESKHARRLCRHLVKARRVAYRIAGYDTI